MRPVRVSAPGKVLLVGGYLVLNEKYAGLVVATTARFYCQVEEKMREDVDQIAGTSSGWRPLYPLTVASQQFGQFIDGWIEVNSEGRLRFQLRECSHRNAYIEETILCAINGIAGLQGNETFQSLSKTKKRVHIILEGDNDFYSQVKRLQDAKLPLRREYVKSLAPFLPPTMEERDNQVVALKTGLGSSAALVTSLVAALVAFFMPSLDFEQQQQDLELVHHLAQLSHCYVQRKIGSGFDVSAACFSSQVYTRFPASILDDFVAEDALDPTKIARCVTNRGVWSVTDRVHPLQVPSSFCLMMGDVSFGTATVSMVRKVLQWQTDQPQHAQKMMDAIHWQSMEVVRGFAAISKLESCRSTPIDWKAMTVVKRQEWSTKEPEIGAALFKISEAYARFRELMREMGTCAGVPIEPPEQTALLDATLAIPGVLLAGVPGAGGYDAICVVVLHESVLHSVEEVWVQWPVTHPNASICPLLCDFDRGHDKTRSGLRMHAVEFQQSSLSERGSTQPTKFNDFSMPISSRQQTCKRKIREADAGVEEEREAATQEQNSRAERVEQKPYSIPGLRFATESWAGRKRSNEDRHMWSQDFYPGPVFGLFDGHGGAFTADFLTRHLVKTVASMLRHHVGEKALHALQESQELSREEALRKEALFDQATILRQQLATLEDMSLASGPDRASNELRDQLTAALVEIDDETQRIATEEAARRQCRSEWSSRQHRCFLRACHDAFERIDGQLLHKNPSQDGSTALLVWFVADALDRDVSLYTVNLGDSRAVLCRGGNGVALTKDHKPDVPAERQRIERAGGYVSNVGGVFRVHTAAGAGFAVQHECSTYLAVSRAFGDRSLKVPTPLVSWTPDVARFDVQADDLFVIVACDGIWDVLSAQEAVDLVLGHVDDAKAAADALVKAAYKKGSEDNLTATVIVFGWQADVLVPHVRAKMSSKMERDEEEIDMFNL